MRRGLPGSSIFVQLGGGLRRTRDAWGVTGAMARMALVQGAMVISYGRFGLRHRVGFLWGFPGSDTWYCIFSVGRIWLRYRGLSHFRR